MKKILQLLFISALVSCNQTFLKGLESESSSAPGGEVNTKISLEPATLILGSSAGFYYISYDGGETFEKRTTGESSYVQVTKHRHISLDKQTIAIGFRTSSLSTNSVHITRDQGQTWSSSLLPGLSSAVTAYPTMSDDGQYIHFSAWGYGGSFLSTDHGATFTKIDNTSPIGAGFSSDGQHLQLVKWGGGVSVSNDFGSSFSHSGSGYQSGSLRISESGEYSIYVDRDKGIFMRSGYGSTESLIFNPSTQNGNASISPDASLFAALNRDDRNVWISEDFGSTWDQIQLPGSSSGISSHLEIPRSSKHGNKVFSVNSTDDPGKLYILNDDKDDHDLVHSFSANIKSVVGTEDFLFIALDNGEIHRANLSDLNFQLVNTIVDPGLTYGYLDAR